MKRSLVRQSQPAVPKDEDLQYGHQATRQCHMRALYSLLTSRHPTCASSDRPVCLPLYLWPYMIIPHYYPSSTLSVSRRAKLCSDALAYN